MIASLPMYERPETAGAHDAFWSAIREALVAREISAPDRLTRTNDLWSHWRSPDLFLSQTCGLPFRSELYDNVRLISTPDYGLADTPPGHYFSVLIARVDDPRDDPTKDDNATMAANELCSQSGWAAPLEYLGKHPVKTLFTGAHWDSARSVLNGHADWAAVDAITWRGIERWSDLAAGLRVFGKTRPTPGLPFITSCQHDPGPIAEAVAEALQNLDSQSQDDLGIRSFVEIPKELYLSIPAPLATLG